MKLNLAFLSPNFLSIYASHHAEYDLELAEADGVDGLGHGERVVGHHPTVDKTNTTFLRHC